MKYAGAEWVKSCFKLPEMSPLGIATADLVGDVFLGIYHLNTASLLKVNWKEADYLTFNLDRSLATVDGDELTRLVLLAHDRMLRVDISPLNFRLLKIGISQRKREGNLYERCPTIESHIKVLREHYSSVEK